MIGVIGSNFFFFFDNVEKLQINLHFLKNVNSFKKKFDEK